MKKKVFMLFNLVVVAGIIGFAYLKFQGKHIVVDGNYDSVPEEIIELQTKYLPSLRETEFSLLFVFNRLPVGTEIETMEKLHAKFKHRADVRAFFTSPFRRDEKMDFPYSFRRNSRITCKSDSGNFDKNFFFVLQRDKIRYLGNKIDLSQLAFLLEKNLNPDAGFDEYTLPAGRLEHRVREKIKKGGFEVMQPYTGECSTIEELADKYSKVYFVHAKCSTCRLKTIISDIKTRTAFEEGPSAIIFSCLADRYSIKQVNGGTGLNVYLDNRDGFDLMTAVTGDKTGMLVFDTRDFKIKEG
ncbi:MAG: hypothetical protein GY765_00880 [bacterium]|nr:hypothetical protein [bacterium]